MFKIPRVNVIESDEGFSVEVLGMNGLKYVQNGKSLYINSELSVAPHDMLIFAMNIKKWDSGEPIDENTKTIIIDNILRAFAWRGIKPDVKYRDQIFTKSISNVIESDDGFSVEILELTRLKYEKDSKITFVAIETIPATHIINILENSIAKWDSGDPIDDKTRGEMVLNIVGALMWDGYKVQSTYRKKGK